MKPNRSLARRAVVYETAMWGSLIRWVLRRPVDTGPDGQAFGYVGVVRMILIAFIALSAFEIPPFDIVISRLVPWEPARWIALGLGVYGLLWMLGLLAMMTRYPHVLDDEGIRVRGGPTLEYLIPWSNVASVGHRYRALPSSRAVQSEQAGDALVLNLGAGSQTSVDVVLREPVVVHLPKAPDEPVHQIRFYADEPGDLVAAARARLQRVGGPV